LQSSLLQAVLRELPLSVGKISICGEVSYASQEPWLFAGTVQQNILFGSPMDNERYKQVKIENYNTYYIKILSSLSRLKIYIVEAFYSMSNKYIY